MNDKDYLELAVKQAELSVEQGGFPAGAIVVKNGEVVSKGVILGFLLHDPTSHAETSSIRQACSALKSVDVAGATLCLTLTLSNVLLRSQLGWYYSDSVWLPENR